MSPADVVDASLLPSGADPASYASVPALFSGLTDQGNLTGGIGFALLNTTHTSPINTLGTVMYNQTEDYSVRSLLNAAYSPWSQDIKVNYLEWKGK